MRFIKKSMVTFGMTVLAVSASVAIVSANNHGGGHNSRHNNYGYTGSSTYSAPVYTAANYTASVPNSLCNLSDCTIVGIHEHNGVNYFGHFLEDGHDNHQLCGVQGCTIIGTHEHNGVYYFGHNMLDGHMYHDVSYNHGIGDGQYHYSEHGVPNVMY